MRISSGDLFSTQIETMSQEMSKYSRLMQQAQGKKLILDSDDPVLAREISATSTALEVLHGYDTNLTISNARSQLFGVSAQNAITITGNIRQTVLKALNDTFTDKDRAALSEQIKGNLEALLRVANTCDSNGNFIFSGSAGQTMPFTRVSGNYQYNGSPDSVSINISSNCQVIHSDVGSSIFGVALNAASDIETLLKSPVTDRAAYHASLNGLLASLDSGMDQIQSWQSRSGSEQNLIKNTVEEQKTAIIRMNITLSGLSDSNTEEVYSALSQQSLILQATQSAYVKLHEVVSMLLKLQL